MLFYRLTGAALLIVGGWFCSVHFNRRIERELSSVEAAAELIRYIKNQVECFSLPVADIIRKCPENIRYALGCSDKSPQCLEDFIASADIPDGETERILREFSSEFGRCYREEQVKGCDRFLSRLEGRRLELNGQLPTRKRISSTLFLSGSFALAILLF